MPNTVHSADLRFDVVIAGGGFAGVYCARALQRALGEEARRRVALIAEHNGMVFQPMLAEVAGSSLSPRHVVNPIRRLCPGVTVLRGAIASIDLAQRSVTLQPGDFTEGMTIGFEHLALCIGGVVDLSRVPGMPEHALLLKNVGDALKLRAAVIDRFEEANLENDPRCQRRQLTFVIVGGGYSGTETAGQILDLAKEMLGSYARISAEALRVVLVHSGPHLLPEINESLGRYAEENLRARGLEIILEARVTAMTSGRVLLANGRTIDTHTVVSTVGNAPNPVLTELCRRGAIECEKGRVITEQTMRVGGQERLWAAGDCAAVPMEIPASKTEEKSSPFTPRPFCPPTAQFALRQGTMLGHNLACVLTSRGGLKTFTFRGLGELASIGHRAAVAEIMGYQFSGFIAWFLWRTIYLAKLPGVERKLRVMMEWTLDLFFPRDISVFQPKPTQMVKEMHLEKGDTLFQAGESATSLYVIKSGRIDLLDVEGSPLRTLTAGEQLGKNTLLGRRVWRFDAEAAEPTTLVAISAKIFDTLAGAGVPVEQMLPHAVLPGVRR